MKMRALLFTLPLLGGLHSLAAAATATGNGAAKAGNEILDEAALRQQAAPQYTTAPGVRIPEGPVSLDWASVKANFVMPAWLQEGKFGIFIHWGVYTVPAHHNEWYARHMYSNPAIMAWHREHFGPQETFGYKDFIPLFKAEHFDASAWALLFKQAGARFVIPAAEHHDRFAMWDSQLTVWNAAKMGPKKDIIGALAKAVRDQGMRYGVSNHRMFGYDFMVPAQGLKTDLYEKQNASFYGPLPSKPKTLPDQEFCNDWLARNIELIEKYQPDFMWFDWDGAGEENPVKLQFAAYYLNKAKAWGKQVAFSQKGTTFPVGTGVSSHERGTRAPKDIMHTPWTVDDTVSTRSWSYTEGMTYRPASELIWELCDTVSKNGTMMLNVSPRSDGIIPEEQQAILHEIGSWLGLNGEAIYGTQAWRQFKEGDHVRFTTKGRTLYVIVHSAQEAGLRLKALAKTAGSPVVERIELLGSQAALPFTQDAEGLSVELPRNSNPKTPQVLCLTGAL